MWGKRSMLLAMQGTEATEIRGDIEDQVSACSVIIRYVMLCYVALFCVMLLANGGTVAQEIPDDIEELVST
jgi:hypothetical protein